MNKLLLIFHIIILSKCLTSGVEVEEANFVPSPHLVTFLINSEGYPVEEYFVTTRDGYILKLFRIPGCKSHPPAKGKTVVFIMHGFLNSAKDWLVSGKNLSIPYLLVEAGYDVFMGNARGTYYSRRHVKHSFDGFKFWQFSWHHIGAYDVPALVEFSLMVSGQKKLHYIGHSQGTETFFIAGSLYPDFNEKIKTMHAFAPVAFLSRMRSPGMRAISFWYAYFEGIIETTGQQELMADRQLISLLGMNQCQEKTLFQEICVNGMFLVCGYDSELLNRTLIPLISRHTPTGASLYQITHYGQAIRSGRFAKYDHGTVKNMWYYGRLDPPSYDLQSVTAPVYLHYSDNDWIVSPADVQVLAEKLGNHVASRRVPHPKFNHLDYVYGINADKLLYNFVVEQIKKDEWEHRKEWN